MEQDGLDVMRTSLSSSQSDLRHLEPYCWVTRPWPRVVDVDDCEAQLTPRSSSRHSRLGISHQKC